MPFNTEPNVRTLSEILAMAPNARQDAITAYFHKASAQHNPLNRFTSAFDPNSKNGGQSSVFCEKTELGAGGKQRVHFNTIGLPAGPGAINGTVLTGNESKSSQNTYSVAVDWVRDAISLTEDDIQMIEAGRNLEATLMNLLSAKMGIVKFNRVLMALVDYAYDLSSTPANWTNGTHRGNVYRVGNRASVHALTSDDTLSLESTNIARAMLNTLGANPLKKDMSKSGCPINKYLCFGSDTAFLPIRNDSLFSTAANADVRGEGNANFTGELLDWQGNAFYELPVTDMAWDDYKGGPLVAKAKVTVEAKPTTSPPKLIVSATNTKSLYFQFFDGFDRSNRITRLDTAPTLTAVEYYAWACNPDGSRVFFAYNGGHNGNQITITKILCPAVTGTTVDQTTVGALVAGSTAAFASGTTGVWTPGGTGANLPTTGVNGAWVYTDTIAPGAVIVQANSSGVTYTRSFMLASMAGMLAHGRVKMARIEQNFDYDFVMGSGFQMIFGTGIPLDPLGTPNGYVLIEHAYELVGYACPSKETA